MSSRIWPETLSEARTVERKHLLKVPGWIWHERFQTNCCFNYFTSFFFHHDNHDHHDDDHDRQEDHHSVLRSMVWTYIPQPGLPEGFLLSLKKSIWCPGPPASQTPFTGAPSMVLRSRAFQSGGFWKTQTFFLHQVGQIWSYRAVFFFQNSSPRDLAIGHGFRACF